MGEEAKTGALSAVDIKAMFAELLDGDKRDILTQVKDLIDQVYADFESVDDTLVESEAEDNSAHTLVLGKIGELNLHSLRNPSLRRD